MDFKIVPFYQPIYDCWEDKIFGYESTTKGEIDGNLVSFEDLYKVSESNVDRDKLDRMARDKSLVVFRNHYKENERAFVNLSPSSSEDSWFLEDIVLRNIDRVVLEITESNQFVVTERIKERVTTLKELGMQIALDDFGVGYTNFNLVYQLEPEFIKLDKFFVSTLESSYGKNVIRGLLDFTEKCNSTLIVEGVETERQKEILVDIGIRYMQGYFFGKPKIISNDTD